MITPARVLTVTALAMALIWSLFLARLHLDARDTILDRLESSLVDLRALAAGPRPPPTDVMIVAVDDQAAQKAKGFPLPRSVLADVVRKIRAGGAKAIALDFLFLDPTTAETDRALADALKGGPTVVAAAIDFSPTASDDDAQRCGLPIPPIATAASVGFVNLSLDRSGIPRHVPMLLACGGQTLPALVLRAASLWSGSDPAFERNAVIVDDRRTPLDVGNTLALHYYGPQGTIPTISAAAFMGGAAPPAAVRGKTVLIGATASGGGDRFPTPFDSVFPGVEVLATAVANLESGDALMRTPAIRRIDAAVMVGVAVAAVLLLTMPAVGLGLAGVAVVLVCLFGLGFIGFSHGIWFAMAMPIASLAPVAATTAAARLGLDRWTELKLRRQQATLGAFQSPTILARLGRDPSFLAQPVERDIAVVFIDLTGFTGLTERLGPGATREIIRAFHALVEEAVAQGGGIVATYMADGAMLIWGLTGDTAQDARRAVETAITLRRRTLAWLDQIGPSHGVSLGVKLGGQFGPAILSRLGHATHQHITAIGDTVNVAARLMEVAAERHSTMALGCRLLDQAGEEGFTRDAGQFGPGTETSIRGREGLVGIRVWTDPRETESVGSRTRPHVAGT